MTELQDVAELAKRRGFFFPANEPYGGTAGFYTYGPEGAAVKQNIEDVWRDLFIREEGHMEVSSPTIMPEPVFEASGHLSGFDDMIIECPSCHATHRADHLVEDAVPEIEDAEALGTDTVAEMIADHELTCPACNESLEGVAVDTFNLMFGTNIGPGSAAPGYLRPETAQGIFVEFPRLKEYARNQLPFGVAQIDRAYRNEISPRRALVRVREFTQAELELFIDPDRDEPPIDRVREVRLPLYSVTQQREADGDIEQYTVKDAIETGIIESPWIAYYLGRSMEFYKRIGIDMDRFRYRQHLAGERAHYAADCWDAETELDGDWIEVTGFASRSDYDLSKHAEYSGEDYTIFRQYDEPRTVERPTVNPDMSYLGPEFGGDAKAVASALAELADSEPEAFSADTVTVTIENAAVTVPVEYTGFSIEAHRETGEHITPHVIEPSFGIDRLVYSVLIHTRCQDVIDDEQRTFLSLPAEIAPTTVAVVPLMPKDGLDETAQELADRLRSAGFGVSYDDTGNIGRRYRRQDEVGTPFCVTVDYETLEDETVTIRDRDSTNQVRVTIDTLPESIKKLVSGQSLAEL